MTHKLESRLPGEISTTSDVQMMPFNGRKWRGIKEHFDEGERGEGKSWLKNQHSKMKIIASSPITSWQIHGLKVETISDFIFLGSKITVDGDLATKLKDACSLAMTNIENILKSRDLTLPTKFYIVKAMVFPVVMYRYENWTIKKTEWWRIDAFELWCWRRLLRVLG